MNTNRINLLISVFLSFFHVCVFNACQPKSSKAVQEQESYKPIEFYFNTGEYKLIDLEITVDSLFIDGKKQVNDQVRMLGGKEYELVFFGNYQVLATGMHYAYIDTVYYVAESEKDIYITVVKGRKSN